jgi:hypothetical protein
MGTGPERSGDAGEDDDEERGGGEAQGGADERGGEVIVEVLHGVSSEIGNGDGNPSAAVSLARLRPGEE